MKNFTSRDNYQAMPQGSELKHAQLSAGVALRPDLAFFPLENDLVVFSESAQKLVGLNATAAFLVQKLRQGKPAAALPDLLVAEFGAPAQEAAQWVDATLEALHGHGLLDNGVPVAPVGPSEIERAIERMRALVPPMIEPFEPKVEAHYRLLDTHAVVRCSSDAQLRMIDAVIGHLRSDEPGAPNFVIDVQGVPWGDNQLCSNIYSDGKPEAQAKRLSKLGPLVKSTLWITAVNRYDYLMNLHAGVVGEQGRCVLLPAAAGSGKSSLTAALTRSGLGYYSDEVALIEPGTFQVPPMPLAICVKSTGWDVMSGIWPELSSLRTHVRDDGKTVRYLAPPPASIQTRPATVSHIFFPRYAKDQDTALTPLSRSDAVTRLLGQCQAAPRRLKPRDIGEIVRWIGAIDCYALTFSSLDQAVKLVRDTAFP